MLPATDDSCLSDEQVCALIAGELEPPELAEATDHLDACEGCRRLVVEASRTQPETSDARATNRYEVVAELGRGGMGIVYRARDRVLQRDVALKLIRREMAYDAATRRRLIRESKVMARLRHPNVAQVYDAGMLDEQVYLAMELVDGTTLREWLEQERTVAEILACYRAAGAGLAAAHAAGLVHRDFKPDNVLVDATGRPLVTDFGLARAADTADEERGRSAAPLDELDGVTKTGRLAGTPAYMAPEQLGAQRIGPQADIFAFCVSVWEALYGKRPFDATSTAARLERIAAGPPRVPRIRTVPAGLRRALAAGLACDPADRPASMEALLASMETPKRSWPWLIAPAAAFVALLAASADEPTQAADPCPAFGGLRFEWPARSPELLDSVKKKTPGYSDLGWISARRDIDGAVATLEQAHAETCSHPAPTAVAQASRRACIADEAALMSAFLELAARTGDSGYLHAAGRVDPQRCRYAPASELARQFGTGPRVEVDDAINELQALRLTNRRAANVEKAEVLLARTDLRPGQRARIQYELADGLAELGDVDTAHLAREETYRLATDNGLSRLAVLVATDIARDRMAELAEQDARRWLTRADTIVADASPGAWREHLEALALVARGRVERIASNADAAERALMRALELTQRRLPQWVGVVLLDLVSLHVRMGQFDDALARVEDLERWAEASAGKRSADAFNARYMRAFILGQLGHDSDARTEALALLRDARDADDVNTARSCLLLLVEYALSIGTPEQMSQALADAEAAYADRPLPGIQARVVILYRCRVANALGDSNRFELCREAYDDAMAHPEIPDAMLSVVELMVELAIERGDRAGALELALEVDSQIRAAYGEDHREAPAIMAQVEALLANGRLDEARTKLERIDELRMGPTEVAEASFLRARVLGPTEEGLASANAAREFWQTHPRPYRRQLAELETWLADSGQPQASPSVSHSQPQK